MYSYTIFIMLLPLLSFLVLGLAGMKMQHKVAGLIGTCSLGLVTILSYTTDGCRWAISTSTWVSCWIPSR